MKHRKRKRAAVAEEDAKIQAATVNLEKLLDKLGDGDPNQRKKGKKQEKDHKANGKQLRDAAIAKQAPNEHVEKGKKPTKRPQVKEKEWKWENEKDTKPVADNRPTSDRTKHDGDALVAKPELRRGLTALQSSMKSSLKGAHFR